MTRRARGVVVYQKAGYTYLHMTRTRDGLTRHGLVFIIGSQSSVFIGGDAPASLRAEFAGATRAKVVPAL